MHKWKDEAKCLGMDTNLFFDSYEEDKFLAASIDKLCQSCPVNNKCFAVGVSGKEWGVHGGVYLKDGIIDKEHNSHKSKQDWFETWKSLTMESS
jgi:hypothetical protein